MSSPLPQSLITGLENRILNYILRVATSGTGLFYQFRKTLAARFKVCVRTIGRVLKKLRGLSLLPTPKRRARSSAVYCLPSVPSNVPSSASPSLLYEVKSKETAPEKKPPMSETASNTKIPLGWDEGFRGYLGIFMAAGKRLGRTDMARAHAVWSGMGLDERSLACEDALRTCQRTNIERYIPFPVNHLLSKAWERTGAPRTMEYIDPKSEENDLAVIEWEKKYGIA